ncbi:MAG: ankyrin repeat domain-containing protein [Micavibrio aeruginosavorus]|nr:ankyrin repeat domain-containing protein [Micavibrio aeruginosavorus]
MADTIAQKRLFTAAATGDKATIRALVFEDVDFDARDEEDRTAFNIATQYGHVDTAKTILAARQMKAMQVMGLTSPQFEDVARRAVRRA